MLLEMAKRRALEVLERSEKEAAPGISPFWQEMHLYRNPIDAQWLGTGLGFVIAKGWAECVGSGEFKLTDIGKAELLRMRIEDTPRLPDSIVPTKLSPKDQYAFAFALKRAG